MGEMNLTESMIAPELLARRHTLLQELIDQPSGLEWCARLTEVSDAAIRAILQRTSDKLGVVPEVAVIATGGYGRMELSPWSDLDLTVIPRDEHDAELDGWLKSFFLSLQEEIYRYWHIKPSYAYRLMGDLAGADTKTLTSLLDTRLLWGAHDVHEMFQAQLVAELPVGQFLIDKVAEREAAFRRCHDTPLVVEPDLKEGAGGLRCFQTANWIGTAIGERPRRATPDYERVVLARNLLQVNSGANRNVLTRPQQGEICERQGWDLFKWMGPLIESMRALHATYRSAREELLEGRYRVYGNVYAARGEVRIDGNARCSEAAYGVRLASTLGLRVPEHRVLCRSEIDPREALDAISRSEQSLRALDACGILEQILPEFTACRAWLPRDSDHQFAVYEHSLRMLRILEHRSGWPGWLQELAEEIEDYGLLTLAILLHDVGKRQDEAAHEELGAEAARVVGQRWNLEPAQTELVAWLVREHLTLARFARLRDVALPETSEELAGIVGTVNRLALLAVLTYADICAVREGAWRPDIESFLVELTSRTRGILQGRHAPVPSHEGVRRRVMRRASRGAISAEDMAAFVETLPATYLASVPIELVEQHAEWVSSARDQAAILDFADRPDGVHSDLTVVTKDEPGLLSRILGVLYAMDLSIAGLRAHTTRESDPMAIDVITVSFGKQTISKSLAERTIATLRSVLNREVSEESVILARGKDPERTQRIYEANYRAGNPAMLEIRAPRGRGLAFRMSRLITHLGWDIQSARVGQWGGLGVAGFYVVGRDGAPVTQAEFDSAFPPQV